MKTKISLLLCLLFIFASCSIYHCSPIKKPADLKPLDLENINDVYTVYWNAKHNCVDIKWMEIGYEITMYGWIFNPYNEWINPTHFSLIGDPKYIHEPNTIKVGGVAVSVRALIDGIGDKLATIDITKKCFVRGFLWFKCAHIDGCSQTGAQIVLRDINDIWFEE